MFLEIYSTTKYSVTQLYIINEYINFDVNYIFEILSIKTYRTKINIKIINLGVEKTYDSFPHIEIPGLI